MNFVDDPHPSSLELPTLAAISPQHQTDGNSSRIQQNKDGHLISPSNLSPDSQLAKELSEFGSMFFDPQMLNTPLESAMPPPSAHLTIPFRSTFASTSIRFIRDSRGFNAILIGYSLFAAITLSLFDFYSSQWFHLLYSIPMLCLGFIELSALSKDIVFGLLGCFDLYYTWFNLLGTVIFGAVGVYHFHQVHTEISGEVAYAHESLFLVSYLSLLIVGTCFLFFDAKHRHRISDRAQLFVLGCLLAILIGISITDRFVRPLFFDYPICMGYCTSTRQLATSCVQTAALFTSKQFVKAAFRDGLASIVSMDVGYVSMKSAKEINEEPIESNEPVKIVVVLPKPSFIASALEHDASLPSASSMSDLESMLQIPRFAKEPRICAMLSNALTQTIVEYHPVLPIPPRILIRITSSRFYNAFIITLTIYFVLGFSYFEQDFGLQNPYILGVSMSLFVCVIVIEAGSADRTMMSSTLRLFDFWYIALTSALYVFLQFYPSYCASDLRVPIVSNIAKFFSDLFALFVDSMIFHGRRSKILVLGAVAASNAYWIYDLLANSQECNFRFAVGGGSEIDTNSFLLSLLIILFTFHFRFFCKSIFRFGYCNLLSVSVKIKSIVLEDQELHLLEHARHQSIGMFNQILRSQTKAGSALVFE